MKKIFTSMMLVLAATAGFSAAPTVADFPSFGAERDSRFKAPAAEMITPVFLNLRKTTYDAAEFDWCYNGFSENTYFGYAIYNEQGKEVAFTVMSQSETDYVTYLDEVSFPEYDKNDCYVESHYYMSTYWVLNSQNGVRFGEDEVFAAHVMEVKDNDGNNIFALRPGTYTFMVGEVNFQYDDYGTIIGVSIGGKAQIQFHLNNVAVSDLKADVAGDHKTAAISWKAPEPSEMPAGAYLYMSVQSGAEVAFDNYASIKTAPANPLTVNVKEGRTYSVSAQYVTGTKKPLGSAVTIHFTVGTNEYTPANATAVVTTEDYVDFSWTAAKQAEYYHVNVYRNGITYKSYTTQEMKMSKQIETGTYQWEVAAFEKDGNGLFYPLTEYIKGNEFTTKSAAVPEGAIEMKVWGMNAAYIADESSAGKYAWAVIFETGTTGGTGLPEPWFAIYSNRELAISGSYSPALGNLDISTTQGNGSFLNTNGSAAGLVQATSGSLKLNFEGFDTEYVMAGYSIPYYSGEFIMNCSDGKTYYGKFSGLICPAFPMEEIASSSKNIISMLGEDGSTPWQGIDEVQSDNAQCTKVIENGQLYILYNGTKYNVQGVRIEN